MVISDNSQQIADELDKGLSIFGVKSAFKFFGTTKEQWLKNNGLKPKVYTKENGKIIMPELGII